MDAISGAESLVAFIHKLSLPSPSFSSPFKDSMDKWSFRSMAGLQN